MNIKGGDKLQKYLSDTARRLGTGGVVRVGFLEGATYPAKPRKPTLPVATVAFWNNFGTSRSPARPFFSDMIAEDSPTWGRKLAAIAKRTKYDTRLTLQLMGEGIQGRLVKKIVDWPADNSPSTVAAKGFNKGLIDQGVMQRSVGYEVV